LEKEVREPGQHRDPGAAAANDHPSLSGQELPSNRTA